eukprot:3740858-Rhodomonas_salina.2
MKSKLMTNKHCANRGITKQKKGEKGGVTMAATNAQSKAVVGAEEMISQGKTMPEITAAPQQLRGSAQNFE